MNSPKFQSVKVWEASLANRAGSTRQTYSKHFKDFLKWTGLTPDQLREMKWQEDPAGKPWERSQVENLLRQYLASLDGYSCGTQRCAYTAVRSFFEANGVPLNLRRQDSPSGCAFGSKTLDPEEIRKIKNAAEYLRDKALIMFLKDSGLRLSDAAKIQWKHLKDYDNGFMGFEIQTQKKKTKARGFVGPETTEMLKIYKRKRLEGTQKLSPEENIEEHPVFSLFSDPTKRLRPAYMSDVIGGIISLAAIEGATPHGLRKFWEQNVHVENIAYQKQMNGRTLTEVVRSYFWKETRELFEMYKVNYHNLGVEKQEFKDVEERLRQEYERETEVLRNQIHELERKNLELTQKLNSHLLSSNQVQELLRRIEKLEKQAQK
jgi:integrase